MNKPAAQMSQAEFREWNQQRHANKRKAQAIEQKGDMVTFRIEYGGDIIGLNDYKSLHWRKLKAKYDPIKVDLTWHLIELKPPPLKWFELRVHHNTRLDLDNLTGIVKPFVDAMRARKIIPEDDKRFWDFLSIQYAPHLRKGNLVFEVTGPKQRKK